MNRESKAMRLKVVLQTLAMSTMIARKIHKLGSSGCRVDKAECQVAEQAWAIHRRLYIQLQSSLPE